MKKIIVSTLLMIMQLTIVQAAQESKMQYRPEPIIPFNQHVDQVVTAFPNMVTTFTFLQEQGLIDQSFRQFLQTRLVRDDIENNDEQDANFGEVIEQAHDLITANMKDIFIQTLENSIKENKTFDQFDNSTFVYLIQHKDNFMHDMVNFWLYEWNKIKDENHFTPLHQAALYNNAEVTDLLINTGADLHIQAKHNKTPLHIAARYNSQEVIHILIAAKASLNIQDYYNQTPLYITAWYDTHKVAHMLIDAGANLNIQDKDNRTALHMTALFNRPEIARMLIDAGANLNIQGKDGRTALHMAALFNHPKIVQMLIDAEANLNLQNEDGMTALHMAAKENYPKIVQMLIDAGANLNQQNYRGISPLSVAACYNRLEIVSMLIGTGANIHLKDNNGKTAEQWAKRPEMRALFVQARQKQDDRTMAIFENQLKKDWR